MNIHGAPTRTQTHIRTSSTTPSKLVSMSLISLNGSNFRSFIGVVSSSHMRGDALFVVAPRLFKLAACGYHDFVPSGAVQSAKAFEPTEHSSRITTRANPEARWFQTASILRPEDGHGCGHGRFGDAGQRRLRPRATAAAGRGGPRPRTPAIGDDPSRHSA